MCISFLKQASMSHHKKKKKTWKFLFCDFYCHRFCWGIFTLDTHALKYISYIKLFMKSGSNLHTTSHSQTTHDVTFLFRLMHPPRSRFHWSRHGADVVGRTVTSKVTVQQGKSSIRRQQDRTLLPLIPNRDNLGRSRGPMGAAPGRRVSRWSALVADGPGLPDSRTEANWLSGQLRRLWGRGSRFLSNVTYRHSRRHRRPQRIADCGSS